jgi:hypothetical protein
VEVESERNETPFRQEGGYLLLFIPVGSIKQRCGVNTSVMDHARRNLCLMEGKIHQSSDLPASISTFSFSNTSSGQHNAGVVALNTYSHFSASTMESSSFSLAQERRSYIESESSRTQDV